MWKAVGIIIFTLILSFINLSVTDVSDIIDSRLFAQTKINPPFYYSDSIWVDSVFNSLTTDERIAQLLMVPAYSNKNTAHTDYIEKLISEYKIGGLIFMQGGPVRQVDLINRYQSVSKVPLLISMEAEWSLSMRLDSCVLYPRQMLLGAIADDQLIYD
ncbi:MAG: glycoside hydrolase family 3 N-terminal domain-containing protein, partial [Bacteroidales bacterium]|nr:glycoside hydrolase family 3 N-terminal domain-containing protein [Bacteroidales bacterium]